jgi:glycine/D-amino acid oxidase-like deaminating enzyme
MSIGKPYRLTYHWQPTERNVTNRPQNPKWGETPWSIDFQSPPSPLPESIDFAVVGAGFTGLSAAAELRRLDPSKSVVVFEAESIGARSSGHTGGLTLAETAAGDLPGLGDVLTGFCTALKNHEVTAEVDLRGVWELDRGSALDSPIRWSDSGRLRVAREVPGGTTNPAKLVSGLAQAALRRGALVFEAARVDQIDYGEHLKLYVRGGQIRTGRVLIATNSESLELSGLAGHADPKFTLAVATEPLETNKLEALGLVPANPFTPLICRICGDASSETIKLSLAAD